MANLTILLAIALFIGKVSAASFANELDKPMDFSCTGNQALHQLTSSHSNWAEDRKWTFGCQPTQKQVKNCVWSGYVNDFDQPVLYQCPGEGFINGIRSYHDNGKEDRRWAFQCCSLQGRRRTKCQFTGYVNQYDGQLAYVVPDDRLIHGISSIHSNSKEDRIFAFETCKFINKGSC